MQREANNMKNAVKEINYAKNNIKDIMELAKLETWKEALDATPSGSDRMFRASSLWQKAK